MAGRARRMNAWRDFERALQRANLSYDVHCTDAPGDAERIVIQAAATGTCRFIVGGGDGTAHEVVNGLMRARASGRLTGSPVVVPVPLGTGNDWARSLRLPSDPDRLAAAIAAGETVPHDVGELRFRTAGESPRWFVNVAGAGFDAHVISQLPTLTPSPLAYLAGALRELRRYRSPEFRIACDGRAAAPGRYLLAFVANGQYCGHRMHVAPPARTDDGRLDVVTIDAVGLLRALPKLVKLYAGTILQDPLVRHETATRVVIESEPPAPVEADGQLVGRTPVEVAIERGVLRVPRSDKWGRSPISIYQRK
jgi:YegS/Rv2252/BmrU family lipid kinase